MEVLGKSISESIERIYQQIKNQYGNVTLVYCRNGSKCSTEQINPNGFKITIDTSLPDDYFGEVFLHEHCHILQYKEGYKDLRCQDQISFMLNDAIMDIDVHRRLKNDYNYQYGTYGSNKLYDNTYTMIQKLTQPQPQELFFQLVISLVLYRTCYNQTEGDRIIDILSQNNESAAYYLQGFLQLVKEYPNTNKDDNRQLLLKSARLFGITHPQII